MFLVWVNDDEAMYPVNASAGCRAVAQLSRMKLSAIFVVFLTLKSLITPDIELFPTGAYRKAVRVKDWQA